MDLPPNPFDFRGKIALVTGAGKGLGSGIALGFARAGATVALHYRSSQDEAQAVVDEIGRLGGSAQRFQADLTQAAQVERLFEQVFAAYGRLDVLVNNAGDYPVHALLEITPDEWQRVIAANLTSVFLTTQASAKRLIAAGQTGAIVNIATIEALFPAYGHAHYSAAKAGVVMATQSAALELGAYGIRVNAVSPGLIGREGIEQSWPDGVERWKKAAPLTRLGTFQDIADACLFLASPASAWITGANLVVDGGVSCRPAF
jgi:NAD(P)-dependent dehydrogenase (short-subunit alcohol dehydrogenase family)